jgi:hypothetical protein
MLKVATYTKEQIFLSGLGLQDEAGLILRTSDLTWTTKAQRQEIIQKFIAFVDRLVKAGIEVEEWPQLREELLQK